MQNKINKIKSKIGNKVLNNTVESEKPKPQYVNVFVEKTESNPEPRYVNVFVEKPESNPEPRYVNVFVEEPENKPEPHKVWVTMKKTKAKSKTIQIKLIKENQKKQIKAIQRISKISSNLELVTELLTADIHSASHIAEMPESTFLKTYGKLLGKEKARQVYKLANNKVKAAQKK